MKHRQDIEGLRGVAILMVVLAHAQFPGWAAGFVGVDVFFVISGYLITGLLATELERRGRVDYWAFFARRARRLAPALLLMVAVVSALCVALLPDDRLDLQLESGKWSALWLSNVYFALASFDYFGAAAQDSLFLHTWSLGVEEQFYLVWPALMVWAWRRDGAGASWLAWLVALGFGFCLALLNVDATSAYYLMPARLWQLALGGLVFRLCDAGAGQRWRAHANALGVGGALLLGASLLLIDATVPYPGPWALLPALAAAALLAAGTAEGSAVSRWLSSPALRFPGRLSYSWYLWHWPVLMLGPLLGWWPLGRAEALAALAVSLLVAWLSYRLVENPVRHSRRGTPVAVVLCSVFASLALFAMLATAGHLASRHRSENLTLGQRVQSLVTVPSVYSDRRCDQWYHSAEVVPCEVEAGKGGSGVMVLVGDSIGTQWEPALRHVAAGRGMRLVVLTKSSCAIVDQAFVYGRIHRRFTECEQWREGVVSYVQRMRPTMVVVGSASTYGFTPAQWADGTARLLERFGRGGVPVVVLAPSPLLEIHGFQCVVAKGRWSSAGLQVDDSDCVAPLAASENEEVIQALRAAAASHGNTHLVYLNDLVCPRGLCRAAVGGQLVFRDQQHLNAGFVQSLGAAVDARLPPAVAAGPNQ